MRKLTTTLALAALLALAGSACGDAGARDADDANMDGAASGNPPERSSAAIDTAPHRPGAPDTTLAP